MAVPAGTFSVGRSVGNREDLQDKIFMISPTDTPAVSMSGTATAEAVLHEWQTDSIRAQNKNNAKLEGDNATASHKGPTSRVQNYCQIMDDVISVSGTQEAIKKAGRGSEMSYQKAKAGKALKIDMEGILFGEQGMSAGTVDGDGVQTAARKARGFESWMTSNVSRGAGGANAANATSAPTDGAQRAFTEALLLAVLQGGYANGMQVGHITALLGPAAKVAASGFAGRANTREMLEKGKIQASASAYGSDFGDVTFMPSLFTRARSALLIDPDFVKIAYLRRMKTVPLAKTGDSEQQQMLVECTLQMGNQAAHGVVADLNT